MLRLERLMLGALTSNDIYLNIQTSRRKKRE